ncbi:MAG: hypothetical protein OZ921_04865 [Sorangiineae bacterium]|nr:hypothetical protein [Polyangiaceae bacterium]MEB2321822.1 hypothetical protein [Sorangiineae bacterium]
MTAPKSPRIDVEWCAFRAGLKPALRLSAAPDEADAIAARYRAGGAWIAMSEPVALRERVTRLVYVAGTERGAALLVQLERRLLNAPSRRAQREASLELGYRLGYPRCCVEGFVYRNHGPPSSALASLLARRLGHDAYKGARDAWVARPLPRLNVLFMPARRGYLSFDPCRYDCELARALAERTADAVAAEAPAAVAEIDAELACAAAISASGARARVVLERGPKRRLRVAHAEAPRDLDGVASDADARFARALVAREVGRRGLVLGGWSFSPPVVVDFAAGGRVPDETAW